MTEADNSQSKIKDPGLAPVDPVTTEASVNDESEDKELSVAQAAEVTKRAEEIKSFSLSSVRAMSLPTYTNEIHLDQMNLGKLKKDKESGSDKKMSEIPFFYFQKDGQRYIFAPPEVSSMAETCLVTSTWFNILKIFQIKPLLCSTGIQNSTKAIKSEIHQQNLKALPYAAFYMSREGVKEANKLAVKQCVLILEHFVLQKKGERYNRKHTKYKTVNTTFLDNFINKKECSEYQKTLLMSIRTILMTELNSSSIDMDTVVTYSCESWNGRLPKRLKETFTKQEQQAISLISGKLQTGTINIDRRADIGTQTRLRTT
jgi:hypothetical protein